MNDQAETAFRSGIDDDPSDFELRAMADLLLDIYIARRAVHVKPVGVDNFALTACQTKRKLHIVDLYKNPSKPL